MTGKAVIPQLRSAFRLLINTGDMTPMAKRVLEKVLDVHERMAEDMMTTDVAVARTIGELAGLPLGTRIATNHGKLLRLDEGYGSQYWFEEGELTPYSPIVDWLPAFILPPAVDHINPPPPPASGTVCELRVEDEED